MTKLCPTVCILRYLTANCFCLLALPIVTVLRESFAFSLSSASSVSVFPLRQELEHEYMSVYRSGSALVVS